MLEIKGFKTDVKKCSVCGKELNEGLLVFVEKLGFVCGDCVKKQNSYGNQNKKFLHKPNKDNMTFSFEFETCEKAPDCCLLYKYDFIPTSDGSINGHEWKSPIYNNLIAVKKMLKTIEPLAKYVDESCGTHIHVGTLSKEVKNIIRSHEVSLFEPTFDRIESNSGETEKFWGRTPTNYATLEFDEERYQAYNPRSDKPTLEFRLPKFITGDQYYNCIKFSLDTTNYLNKTILTAKQDGLFDQEYKKQKRFMKEQGMILLDIYKKYAKATA